MKERKEFKKEGIQKRRNSGKKEFGNSGRNSEIQEIRKEFRKVHYQTVQQPSNQNIRPISEHETSNLHSKTVT